MRWLRRRTFEKWRREGKVKSSKRVAWAEGAAERKGTQQPRPDDHCLIRKKQICCEIMCALRLSLSLLMNGEMKKGLTRQVKLQYTCLRVQLCASACYVRDGKAVSHFSNRLTIDKVPAFSYRTVVKELYYRYTNKSTILRILPVIDTSAEFGYQKPDKHPSQPFAGAAFHRQNKDGSHTLYI